MLLTEEEASTKRCQESFPACQDVSIGGAFYATSWHYPPPRGLGVESVATAPLNCVGSACMAWRWHWSHRLDGTHEHIYAADGAKLGYCGKGGRP